MSDLIERKSIRNLYSCLDSEDKVRVAQVLMDIDAIPTIDAVEVVRCKECVWNDGKGHCKLRYGSLGVFDDVSCDDYCNYGERKEDE